MNIAFGNGFLSMLECGTCVCRQNVIYSFENFQVGKFHAQEKRVESQLLRCGDFGKADQVWHPPKNV